MTVSHSPGVVSLISAGGDVSRPGDEEGLRRPKVFKLARRRLTPGQPVTVTRRHRFAHVSVRRIHRGRHTIDIQVNGHVLGAIDLDVLDPAAT